MNYQMTVTSIFSIMLFNFCFVILLAIVLENKKLLSKVKYELLMVCMFVPVIKILVPMELLPWTKNVNVPYVLPEIVKFINKKLAVIGGHEITVWSLVLCILAAGILVNGCWMVISYASFRHDLKLLCKVEDPEVYETANEILSEQGKKISIDFRWIGEGEIAKVTGLRKPIIMLPKKDMSKEELESVLRHEIAHYLHGDLWIRMGWVLIRIVCWWNPAVYILDRQFEQLIEIRADKNAIKNVDVETSNYYMETIVKVTQDLMKHCNSAENGKFSASFKEKRGLTARDRILLILGREKGSRWSHMLANLVTMTCIILLTIAMNVFIFEPKGKLPDENYEKTEMLSGENGFLIENEDGTYDLYYQGRYCISVDDDLGSNMPIYKSLEEALKYEEIH